LTLALVTFAFAGVVGATSDTSRGSAQVARDTSANVPAAQQTAPLPVLTGAVPPVVSTGEPVTGNPDAQVPGTTGGTQNGGFPWLPVAILAVVVILGIVALMLMRSRRAATATVATAGPAPRSTTTAASTTTTMRGPGAVAYGAAPAAAVAATSTGAAPATITCPNCGTSNSINENFCHECGQDLRPTRQSMMAAAAPPADVVTDDMPYLETMDRTDEQLEYVLSRPRVVLGAAAGSDVVIGEAFNGYETVSPRHAELRKEGDGFTVVDLDSENGTFVNDVRTGENLLSDGDVIRLGSVRFVFRVPQA
jgi:hypothetical protein